MATRLDLPVVDHHCHLSPVGDGVQAAARFRAEGGTHLFLTTQNYAGDVPLRLDDYREQYVTTERLAERVRAETGVVVYVVLAPYPVDLLGAIDRLGPAAALELHQQALELAGKWIRERRAVALGEVGRPHFPTDPRAAPVIDEALGHAFRVARESDAPVVLHTEELDAPAYQALASMARRAGVDPSRVVKHYARSRVDPDRRDGIAPSYLARRPLVRTVLDDRAPWFLETDFLDDPRRPGAVLDLATVPRRAQELAREGRERFERLAVPFVESIERVYGITPRREEVPAG